MAQLPLRVFAAALLLDFLVGGALCSRQMMMMPQQNPTPPVSPAQPLDSCVVDPATTQCAAYMYPASLANADLDTLCASMPFMIGCSLRAMCQAGSVTSPQYCAPVSLLQTICLADPGMEGMNGCANIRALCANTSSVVAQCRSQPSAPGVIGTMSTVDLTVKACNQMNMDGCDLCPSNSACKDPLMAMSRLCQAMWMDECQDWSTMCKQLSSQEVNPGNDFGALCGSSSSQTATPMMRMYFHTGILDYVLFYEWVPRTDWQYALTVLAVLCMGVWVTLFRYLKIWVEKRFFVAPAPGKENLPPLRILAENSVRAAFTFLIGMFDFSLMLISMTFNVGLFFAVIGGLALGQLVFGHWLAAATHRPSCCGE